MTSSYQSHVKGAVIEYVSQGFLFLPTPRTAGVLDGLSLSLSNCPGGEEVETSLDGKPVLSE